MESSPGRFFLLLYVIPFCITLISQGLYYLSGCMGGYIDTALQCKIPILVGIPLIHGIGNMLIPLWLTLTSPLGFILAILALIRAVKKLKASTPPNPAQ